MKRGQSYQLVRELARTLNAELFPPVKDGVAYQFLFFHASEPTDLWVAALIPFTLNLLPAELLTRVTQSYGSIEQGADGILFFEHSDPHTVISQVDHWYHVPADQNKNTRAPEPSYCN